MELEFPNIETGPKADLARYIERHLMVRKSPRLSLLADIVLTFSPFSAFTRAEVMEIAQGRASPATIDRALADMEAAGMVECIERNKKKRRGGAIYSIKTPENWHRRAPGAYLRRGARSGRGSPGYTE